MFTFWGLRFSCSAFFSLETQPLLTKNFSGMLNSPQISIKRTVCGERKGATVIFFVILSTHSVPMAQTATLGTQNVSLFLQPSPQPFSACIAHCLCANAAEVGDRVANEFFWHNPHRSPEDDELFTASYFWTKAPDEWGRAGWANPGRLCKSECTYVHAYVQACIHVQCVC